MTADSERKMPPYGWQRCSLPDFACIVMGQSPSSRTYNHSGDGIPFFQGKAEFGDLYPTVKVYCSRPQKVAKQGATLLSVRAPVGPTNLARRDCCIGRGLAGLHPCEEIEPKFLLYLFRNIEPVLSGKGTGSTFKAITKGFIEDLEFNLPPLAEQHRIVAKIEELFSELDKGVESLETARTQIKVYRQAVLKHAFEGKLTAQWREENKDKLETPEQLLARIKQERKARYGRQLQEWKAAVKEWEESDKSGKKPPSLSKLKEISRLSLDETRSLPYLADGWSYLRLGLVIDEPKYGTSKKCDYNYAGTGVLRIPNVIGGVVDASDLKGAHFEEDEKRTYTLKNGDVLVVRSNGSIAIVGKYALISKADERYLFAGYLIRLRCNAAVLLPDYLAALFSSHLLRIQIEYKAKSTSGVNNINSSEIQSFIVPLCSPSEQKVVVELLSTCLSAVDDIEAKIDNQLLRAYALRQSILSAACAGQLVAQNPSDEPASILLNRIKAEKDQSGKNGETTKKTKKKRGRTA